MAGDVRGYGGPINLWVRFDAEGTLEQVVLRSHQETPSYLRDLPAWLRLLEGHRYRQPFVGAGGVDAVSGATVTSDAILRILDRARARAASDLLGLARPAPTPAAPSRLARLFDGVGAFVVTGFLVLMLLAYRFGGWGARLALLGLSVGLLGLWLNVPFATVDVAGLSLGVLPGAGAKGVLVLGVLAVSVAFGQVWCGYGCPFGALQELVWLLVHPRGVDGAAGLGNARRISPELEMRARYVKFGLLALVLCFYWLSGNAAYLALDPMTTAFTRQMAGYTIWMLVVIGLLSLLYFRPFCRYLCPAGAFLALFNKVRLLDRFARPRALARCDLGVTRQDHVDCLKCNRCLARRAEAPRADR